MFDGFLDILPLSFLWFLLMASVTWAALQLYVGARLLGPLGICMAWAIYQVSATPQLLQPSLIIKHPMLVTLTVRGYNGRHGCLCLRWR